MNDEEITRLVQDAKDSMNRSLQDAILSHIHDGNFSQRINFFDIFSYIDGVNAYGATIATTGNSDVYIIAPLTGRIIQIDFSGTDALAASNTNYITWTVTNLGQSGSGTAALLSTSDANTTKSTGGTAISANTKRTLTLTSTNNDLNVVQGDRIRVRAAVTGTLANTVTFPVYLLQVQTQ